MIKNSKFDKRSNEYTRPVEKNSPPSKKYQESDRQRTHSKRRSSSSSRSESRQKQNKYEVVVKEINFDASEREIISFLEKNFGRINRINLLKDYNGRSKGLAFVDFTQEKYSQKALQGTNIDFMGRYLVIEKPKPRAERLGNAMLEDSTTIFVGNLSFKTESEDIRGFFSSCGDIVSCRIALQNGKSRGFGHIEFSDKKAIQKALKMGGEEIDGRQIKVDVAANKAKSQMQSNHRAFSYENRNRYERADEREYNRRR